MFNPVTRKILTVLARGPSGRSGIPIAAAQGRVPVRGILL
jgi:hypothetical protein